MADYEVIPTAVLLDSEGAAVPGAVVQFVQTSVNAGWTASATMLEGFDCDQDQFQTMTIRMRDSLGGELTTPPMVFPQTTENGRRNTEGAGLVTVQLEDLSGYKMRTPNQNFPSFLATTSAILLTTLGDSVGVTVADPPDVYITEEEVKGEQPEEAVGRIRQAFAYETVVESDGTIRFYPWEAAAADLDWDWSNWSRSLNKTQRYTGLRIGKTSSIPAAAGLQYFDFSTPGGFPGTLSVPLIGPVVDISESLVGSFGSVTFFNEAGQKVEHYFWAPAYEFPLVESGTGPAVSFYAVVLPGVGPTSSLPVQARLKVLGTPYSEEDPLPDGVDQEFLWPAAGVSLGAWPYRVNIIEPLFPGLAYGIERHPHILDRINSAADTLKMDGIFRCHDGVRLRNRFSIGSRRYKTMSIRWEPRGAKMNLELARITSDA
jgi:hypothetical protein